jgi:hypothetical protein
MIWIVLAGLLLVARPVLAQPVYDTSTSSVNNGASSQSFSHTTTTNGNRLMIGCVAFQTSETITAITYGGTSLGAAVANISNGDVRRLALYRLVGDANIATGSNTLAVTFSDFTNSVVGVTTYYNVDQTTPIGTTATQNDIPTDASINVSSAVNEIVHDCFMDQDNKTISYGAGQSSNWTAYTGPPDCCIADSTRKTGTAGTVNMTRTWDGANQFIVMIGVSIKEAAAAAAAAPRRRINQ